MSIPIQSQILANTPAKNLLLCAKTFLLLTMATLMSGCYSFGPDGLKGTHPLYNEAIVDSQNEQFIQNIVRLHYRIRFSFWMLSV